MRVSVFGSVKTLEVLAVAEEVDEDAPGNLEITVRNPTNDPDGGSTLCF
jgi:hypothetical protein